MAILFSCSNIFITKMKQFIQISGLLLFICSSQLIAQITVSSPAASSSITTCNNYIVRFSPGTGYSGNATAEVHQNKSSGAVVKTYGYPSTYLEMNYDNTVSACGLCPGNYQLKVYDAYNSSNYGWSEIFTVGPLPAPPSVSLESNSGSSFEIRWTSVTGATEFRLDVATTSDFQSGSILPSYNDYHASGGDSGGFYVTGVNSSTVYYVRVRAYNSCSTSSNSPTLTVSCPLPSAPTATPATSVTATSFVANWNAVSQATGGYNLIITRSGDSPITIQTSNTSYTYSSAHPSSSYNYKVRSIGCGGTSGDSNVISLTTSALGVPVYASAGGSGGTGSPFEWTVGWTTISGATTYNLQVSPYNTFSSIFYSSEASPTHDSFEADYCREYFWRVRAKCATGEYSQFSPTYDLQAGACRTVTLDSQPVENEDTDQGIAFYPNPAENYLRINLPKVANAGLLVHVNDMAGRDVHCQTQISTGYAQLDISNIPSGFYIISVSYGSINYKGKFVRR